MKLLRSKQYLQTFVLVVISLVLSSYNPLLAKTDQKPPPSVFSEKYDPRPLNRAAPIKNQSSSIESCWAFVGTGALESYFKVTQNKAYNFSEEHARFYTSNENVLKDQIGFIDRTPDSGSDINTIVTYFTNWQGPVSGKAVPYTPSAHAPMPQNMDSPVITHVWETKVIDNNISEIKSAILNYGGVPATIYFGNSKSEFDTLYNQAAYALNSAGSHPANHGVVLVGWDNNFSKNSFKNPYQPSHDGAWLVRNSGGNTFDNGYFWVSYEESALVSSSSFTVFTYAAQADPRQKMLSYDPQLCMYNLSLGNKNSSSPVTLCVSNVFEISPEDAANKTVLSHIMYQNAPSYLNGEKSYGHYKLYVAPLDSNSIPNQPSASLLCEGDFDHYGYDTITPEIPYTFSAAGKYAVILELSGANVYTLYCEGSSPPIKAIVNPGESYYKEGSISLDAPWKDVSADRTRPLNFSIRAILTAPPNLSNPKPINNIK